MKAGAVAAAAAPAAAVAALAVAALGAGPAAAQLPGVLAPELRAGAAVGAFAPTGAGLEMVPGPAWGAALTWGPGPLLGGYVAFSSVGFGCESAWCDGSDVSLLSRGLSVGLRGEAPIAAGPWLRAGVLFHRLDQRWTDIAGDRRSETADAGAGVEAAAGLSWRIGERVSLTPGIHVGFLPTRAPDGVKENAFFSALDVGLRFRFD